ncbi:MAG: FtsX-like permease family protein [Methanobacteriota archaeon]
MILDRKACFAGVAICSLLFSLSIPMLLGIGNLPEEAFGQKVMTLSQASSADPIKEDVAAGLWGIPGVTACSPEVYSFCVIGNEPVFVRGVVLEEFLKLEGASLNLGAVNDTWRFAVLGEGLAGRLDARVGDRLVLTGSIWPSVTELNVTGIYSSANGTNDMLVPLWVARSLCGLADGDVHAMRLRVSNITAVTEHLEETGNPIIVTEGGGSVSTPINTNVTITPEQQLALRYLDSPSFKASNGSYVSMFVQEGTENVQVVIVGFIILECALTFIGTTAVMARGFSNRRRDIGVLGAIGASRLRIMLMALGEVAPVAVAACALGVAGGMGAAMLAQDAGAVVMFGRAVEPILTTGLALAMFASTLAIALAAGAVSAYTHASAKPDISMRESGEEKMGGEGISLEGVLEGA